MKKSLLILAAAVLSVSLAACGGSGSSAPANNASSGSTAAASSSTAAASTAASTNASNESTAASDASAAEAASAAADLSNPTIVIESGDIDGITDLGKKMQNFEVPEGTVIKITGLFVKNTSTPSIMEANEAGDEKKGISLFLDEGIEEPANDTPVEAVGTAVKGNYFMEFHVSADGFKVLE